MSENTTDWSKLATFAVVEAARKGDQSAATEAVDRLDKVYSQQGKVLVLITSDGHWGRGESVEEAAKVIKKLASTKAIVYGFLVFNDPKPYVDNCGFLVAEASSVHIGLGKLGSLGGLLK